jgi:RNA polymerase sigma factor (sigma-70 family)
MGKDKEDNQRTNKPKAAGESAQDFAKRLGTKWKQHWDKKYEKFIDLTAKSLAGGNRRLENDLKADGLLSFLVSCEKHQSERAQLSTFFTCVLKQKMFKVLRREKRLKNKFKTIVLEPECYDRPEPSKRVIRLKKLVFRTITEMPDQESSKLLLEKYYNYLSVKELAKKYNCNNKQIYYRLRKALGQLKKLCYKINLDDIFDS